jgi:membrane protein implicated in regulation of membrane protease activity
MPAWAIWLILAALLGVAEVLTLTFFLGAVALAAVVAALVASAGGSLVLQLLAFVVASVLSIWLLRPLARRHVHTPPTIRTGTAALVGRPAVVLERVDEHGGRVRIGGEEWSARAFFEDQVIEPGARVEVAKIEGASALVYE